MTPPNESHEARDNDADDTPVGIRCPDCGCRHCPVDYTRPRRDHRGGKTIRRRTCRHCGRPFVTVERVA